MNQTFYKIYLDDFDYLLNDKFIGAYLKTLTKSTIVSSSKNHFFVAQHYIDSFGWMPDVSGTLIMSSQDGYTFYIKNRFEYKGEYISVKKKRKLKLEKLDNSRNFNL